jgi:nucleoside-diphosphate-sugar epimerase
MVEQGLIAVTGASGYIGKVFTTLAEARGHQIAKLGRQTSGFTSWMLEADDLTLPAQPLKAVMHLAHDWTDLREPPENRNITGTRRLFEAVRAHSPDATIVLASSVSARVSGGNVYGRIKAAQEDVCREFGGISARIALVFGGKSQGQMKTLIKIARCPILAVPGGQILVQPIHVSDVAEILLHLAHRGGRWSGTYIAAGEPVRLLTFLEFLATATGRRTVVSLSLPLLPIRLVLAVAARMNILRQLRERVEGLAATSICWPAGPRASTGKLGADRSAERELPVDLRWVAQKRHCYHDDLANMHHESQRAGCAT